MYTRKIFVDFSNLAVPKLSAYLIKIEYLVEKENLLSSICVCTCIETYWDWSDDINRGKTTGMYE
jgi:hypothetical protein